MNWTITLHLYLTVGLKAAIYILYCSGRNGDFSTNVQRLVVSILYQSLVSAVTGLFSRSVIQYCSSSLIAVAMRVRPKICIKYSKLSPFSQHPIVCSLTYFDPELYVFYSPNWYFYHFYVNQCFRADDTMFRNSNFVVFLAHEKMKKQQDTYQNCRNCQYTAKKSPVRPDS